MAEKPRALRGPSPAATARDSQPTRLVSPSTRELAQRQTGTVEVVLLWHPELDRLELAVHDRATGAGFAFEVAPAEGIDAFYHPYAYAARRWSSHRVVRAETAAVDA